MLNKVFTILQPLGIPILWLKRPETFPSISFHFFSEGYLLHGDGKGKERGGALQVDIFSQEDYTALVADVQERLEGAGFILFGKNDNLEKISDTKEVYHKVLTFNYAESEV